MPCPHRALSFTAAGLAVAWMLLGLPLPAAAAAPAAVAKPPPAPLTVVTDQVERRTGWRHLHSRFRLPKATGLAALAGFSSDRSFEAHTLVLPRDGYRARLVDQPNHSQLTAPPISLLTQRSKARLGINGGYFDANFEPVGLYVLGGLPRRPFRQAQLLSATVFIGSSGRLEIRTRSEPYANAQYALQCGPLLIDPGGELGIKSTPGPEARRTVLGLGDGGELLVISTTAVSLRALAEALHDHPEAFGATHLERALNLDGGPSTALTALYTVPPLQIEALTPVRTAIIFYGPTPRRPSRKSAGVAGG